MPAQVDFFFFCLASLGIPALISTDLSVISINNQLLWFIYEDVKIKTWIVVCQGYTK